MKTKYDDGLEWLREIRRRIAKRFDYDPRKQAQYFLKRQEREKHRLYRREDHLASKSGA